MMSAKADLAPIDTSVVIPKAVKARAARAEEIHNNAYKKEPVDEPGPKDNVAEPAPPAEPVEVTPQGKEPPPAAAPAPEPPSEDWKHKYESMKGRFDRSQEQLRGLSDQVGQLTSVVSSLKAAPPIPAPSPHPNTLITPEEEADYGSEFLKVVGKKAQELFNPEVDGLKKQIDALQSKLDGVGGFVAQTAQSKLFEVLDRDCAGWREINMDQNFLAWLRLPDTYSGAIRHELLKVAFERNDGPRVLAFFQGFLAEEAAVDPVSGGDIPLPAALAPGKVPLEQLAAPGRAKSAAATPAPAEKPLITRAQIAKFYADIAAQKYRGKEAEKDRLEKMIFEAERDGRIR
jgi:hypothetical protein